MIARTASQAKLDTVTRCLIIAGAVIGSVVTFLVIRALIDIRSAAGLNASSRALETQEQARSRQAPQPTALGSTAPRGLDALRLLQAAVTQGAVRNHCQLAEFKSATQTAPYTPRYKKNLPDQPWTQMDSHFTINGRLRDVMETLRGLGDVPVPIEIDGLNIARERILADGSTTVTAQLDLRALTQGAPR